MEKCIGCELCAGVCPAKCIYVRGADNPIDDPVSPGERYGFVYEINYLRCIHCDLCVEACPTEAITETKLFEFSFTNRADAIYTKDELLVDDDGRARRQPWELWLGGEDDHTSAWMRATAPSGRPSYEGRVGWSGELGFGVRPPEQGQIGRRRADRTPRRRRRTSTKTGPGTLMDARPLLRLRARRVIAGALGVVLARNPVHSALFLVVTLVSVAVLFLQQDADLARRGADRRVRRRDRRAVPVRDHAARRRPARVVRRPAAVPAAAAIVLGVLAARRDPRSSPATTGPPAQHADARRDQRRHAAASAATSSASPRSLFTDFLWPFEITAVLLVIAVVGSVVLARRSGQRPTSALAGATRR